MRHGVLGTWQQIGGNEHAPLDTNWHRCKCLLLGHNGGRKGWPACTWHLGCVQQWQQRAPTRLQLAKTAELCLQKQALRGSVCSRSIRTAGQNLDIARTTARPPSIPFPYSPTALKVLTGKMCPRREHNSNASSRHVERHILRASAQVPNPQPYLIHCTTTHT